MPLPWLDTVPAAGASTGLAPGIARRANDALAAAIAEHPARFVGVGAIPTTSPNTIEAELEYVVEELGFAGGVIAVGPTVKRVDHRDMDALFATAARLGAGIWMHPSRPIDYPEYADERQSRYLDWQTLGWLLDTSNAMERIVFSGVFDRHPDVKIITHHHGALIPLFASRMQLGWDSFERDAALDLGTTISRPYIEHFKKFYADTATFGIEPRVLAQTVDFFGSDHVLFGTDTPMDPGDDPVFLPNAMASVDQLNLATPVREAILAGNAHRVFGAWLPANQPAAAAS